MAINQEIQDKLVSMASQGNPGDLTTLMEQVARNQSAMDVQAFRDKPATVQTAIPGTGGVTSTLPGVASTASINESPKDAFTLDALKAKQQEILSTQDSGDRFNKLAALNGAVEGLLSTKVKNASALAHGEYRVNELKAALEQNIQMDRNTPAYVQKYGMADSDETAQVRAQYQAALNSANSATQKYIAADPEFASIKGEFESFIKVQEQLTAQEYSTQAKAKEFGADIRKTAKFLTNGSATDDLIVKDIKKYAALSDIARDPEALVQATLTQKDPEFGILLASKQAEKISGTDDINSPAFQTEYNKAFKDIQLIKGIKSDKTAFDRAFNELYSKNGILGEEKKTELLKVQRGAANSAEGAKLYEAYKQDVALTYVRNRAKSEFLGNLDSWITTDAQGTKTSPFTVPGSPLTEAYSLAKTVTPDVSLKALVSQFKTMPPEKRVLAQKELMGYMKNAKDHASAGYFSQFADDMSVEMEVNGAITGTVLNNEWSTGAWMLEQQAAASNQ